MDALNPFYLFLRRFVHLSEEGFDNVIRPYAAVRRFAKRDVITAAGEVENHFNFMLQGLVRKYYRRGDEEINTQLATEGHLIHVQESFHTRTPSAYTIEAIEPSTLVSITYDDLEKIYAAGAQMERLGRLVTTFTAILRDRWQMQLIKLTPRERFLSFVERHPDLMQRVPQKYLASYLSIQPETFSRFKHLVRERKAPVA